MEARIKLPHRGPRPLRVRKFSQMTGIKRIKLTEFHLRLTQKQRLYRREVICGNQIVNDVVPEPDKRQKPVIARTFGHILRFTYRQTYILIRSPLINIISADTLFIQMYIIPRQTQNLRGVSPCVVTEQKKVESNFSERP